MVSSASSSAMGTFMVVCPTSFFLGVLFSLFPYDYPLLWSANPITEAHLISVESHLNLLYNSPNLITRIFHIVLGLGLCGMILKLYKPSESNMLFDGGSLVLYMVAVIIYLTNTIKGLRIVNDGTYGLVNLHEMSQDQLDDVDASGHHAESGNSVLGREDTLRVFAASNTITALVLVGVIVLQIGQWYADRVDARERQKLVEEMQKQNTVPEPKSPGAAASPTVESEPVKRASKKNK